MKRGYRHILAALRCSLQGLKSTFQSEVAFRQEIYAIVILIPIACWLTNDAVERILLIGSLLLVLIIELLNSSIESTVDRISKATNPLSKKAKDQGSAAVLVTLILCVLTWAIIGYAQLL